MSAVMDRLPRTRKRIAVESVEETTPAVRSSKGTSPAAPGHKVNLPRLESKPKSEPFSAGHSLSYGFNNKSLIPWLRLPEDPGDPQRSSTSSDPRVQGNSSCLV